MNKLVASLFAGLFFVPVALAACGGPAPDSPERFEAACEKACVKLASLGCENFPTTVDQCKAGCPYLEEQLDGFCVAEYSELYECSAELDYTCKDGNPYPSDLNAAVKCNDASLALSKCMQGQECKKYCRAAVEAGCGGASEDACVTDCEAARPADSVCTSDYDRLRECQTENMVCENGKPSSADCDFERTALVRVASTTSATEIRARRTASSRPTRGARQAGRRRARATARRRCRRIRRAGSAPRTSRRSPGARDST